MENKGQLLRDMLPIHTMDRHYTALDYLAMAWPIITVFLSAIAITLLK